MADENTISSEVSNTENQTIDTEAMAAEEAKKIASSESDIDWSDDSSQAQSTEAPNSGNSEEETQKTPDARQPEDDEVDKAEAETEDTTDGEDAESDEDASAQAEAEKLMRQRMGLAPTKGDENYEAVEKKYQEASREAHRLVDEKKAMESMLKDLGVQVIQREDGQFAIAPTEDYGKNFDVEAVAKQIEASLPKELEYAFDSDEAKAKVIEHISKEAHRIELQKRPVTNATSDDIRLSNGIVDSIFNEMVNETVGSGDLAMPLYADLENDDVVDHMLELFQHPAARDFYVQANKSPENMKWFLDAVHAKVFRGRAPVLAKLADAKKQKSTQKNKKLGDASVATDSSKTATDHSSSKSGGGNEAAEIAGSGAGNSWL